MRKNYHHQVSRALHHFYDMAKYEGSGTSNPKILTIPFGNMAASSNISETTEKGIPNWKITGDWFDVCKCNVPCPCM